MGIENRDYLREPTGRPGYNFAPGSVCKWIIIANVVVFLFQNFGSFGRSVTFWLALDPSAVMHGQVWRLLTYAFCHSAGDPLHILFNMLFVWWFGKTLESMYGSREFLLFYLSGAFVAGLCFLGLRLFLHEELPAIGASGAVMAIVMVYALYYPRHKIYLMAIIPLEIRWLVVMYVIFDGLPVLKSLSGQVVEDRVAHAAHLGGLAFGFLYYRYHLRLENTWLRLRSPRWDHLIGSRRKLRIYQPEEPRPHNRNLDEQVDRILEKIHAHGEASLTDEERETLKQASREYRNRP